MQILMGRFEKILNMACLDISNVVNTKVAEFDKYGPIKKSNH